LQGILNVGAGGRWKLARKRNAFAERKTCKALATARNRSGLRPGKRAIHEPGGNAQAHLCSLLFRGRFVILLKIMKEPLQPGCPSLLPPGLENAFTRIELLCVLSCIGILGILALPLGAHQRRLSSRTEELLCQANLREIGRAYQLWASDHDDLNPFLVETNQGGIKGIPVANNLWYQFAWISNQVRTPKIFVCPADTNTTRVANDFSSNPNGGFLNPNYRNNAISYFLGFHTFPENPRAILAGDRNIPVTRQGACTYAGLSVVTALEFSFSVAPWDDSIHGVQGNLLFNDTSADMYSTDGLNRVLASPTIDSQRIHFLKPR